MSSRGTSAGRGWSEKLSMVDDGGGGGRGGWRESRRVIKASYKPFSKEAAPEKEGRMVSWLLW